MKRLIATMLLVGLVLPLAGCGSSGGTGKNKDYDRPRTQSSRP